MRYWLVLGALLSLWGVFGCSDDGGQVLRDGGADIARDSKLTPDGSSTLAPGQFRDFVASAAGVVEGTLTTGGDETYILLLMSLDPSPLKAYPYTTTAVTATSGTLDLPALDGEGDAGRRIERRPCRFQQELERIIASRPRRLFAPKKYLAAGTPPKVGDQRSFKVEGQTITAEAVLVDSAAAYWVDRTTQPQASVDPQVLDELSKGFGGVVVPRERVYFGQESDLDGDGHIAVLFSPLVTQSGAMAYVSPCDLLDPTVVPACAGSNQAEILYAPPPSDLPSYMGSSTAQLELFAHELQHAIYFFRKFVSKNSLAGAENPYLHEGMSDLAVDLCGYNLGLIYRYKEGLDEVDSLSVPNLTTDSITSYVPGADDGIMRGGADVLLRYLFDQAGGDDIDAGGTPKDKGGIKWLRSYVDDAELGQKSILGTAGLTVEELTKQFWTALALSNRGPSYGPLNPDPRYNFLPVAPDPVTGNNRGLNLYGTVKSTKLMGPRIQSFTKPDGSLRSGGAELLQLVVNSTLLRFAVKTKPEAKAMVRVIRTR